MRSQFDRRFPIAIHDGAPAQASHDGRQWWPVRAILSPLDKARRAETGGDE